MYTKRLALACERLFDLDTLTLSESYYYASLPLCVIDAVFSIGVKYTSTQNAVRSYCRYFGLSEYQADIKSDDAPHRISQMVSSLEKLGVTDCADLVFCNHQRTSARSGILKAEAVLKFAKVLQTYGIETLADFREKGLPSGAETEIMQIPGQKSGLSLRYFYMLAGDDSFAKPDRHVLRFIKKYAGVDLGIQGAQELLQSTVHELNMNHPNVTVRLLDYAIWDHMAHGLTSQNVKTYNKLVRDRIPEIIEASGKRCQVRELDEKEYLRMIDAKLDEELAEYHKDQNLEELADLLEVIYAAAVARGYSIEQLEKERATKAKKRGAFEKRLLLLEVEEIK